MNNPIGTRSGQDTLMLKPAIQTQCLFGFDPEHNCAQCMRNIIYSAPALTFMNGYTMATTITINLNGDLCTQITGQPNKVIHFMRL